MKNVLVAGGAGFIGSNYIIDLLNRGSCNVVNVDKLTYAGNLQNLSSIASHKQYIFTKVDICESEVILDLLSQHNIGAIVNFAAESHVDRSIHGPEEFIQTNIVGTFRLLESARSYWSGLPEDKKNLFRFLHVSTDEVYGSLEVEDPAFKETDVYKPNSPYSASKASSDHLVRSYFHTYGLPVLTTNCSNNYGPYQFPEKLIPLVLHNALKGEALPIYGNGLNIRDWLHVIDHCVAINAVLNNGRPGETYNIGGLNEKTNLEVVNTLCAILDELRPRSDGHSYKEQITFVKDRAGHDQRYAIDARKIEKELDWRPKESFETGMHKTVEWYLENQDWVENITSGAYRDWIERQYV